MPNGHLHFDMNHPYPQQGKAANTTIKTDPPILTDIEPKLLEEGYIIRKNFRKIDEHIRWLHDRINKLEKLIKEAK